MKTTVKTIAAGLILTASVFTVNANDLSKNALPRFHVADYELKVEGWMVDINTFEPKSAETAAGSVVDIALSSPDFSILVEAVSKAGLVEALSAAGPFIKDLTAAQLKPILTYHVVSGKVMSTDLSNTSVATLNGQKIKIDLSNGVKINESNVVKADISGSNGVVHVIDRVLIPN